MVVAAPSVMAIESSTASGWSSFGVTVRRTVPVAVAPPPSLTV